MTKTKPLSSLRNTSKGPIHHMEIHPAKNSSGGRAFITKTFRKPSKKMQADALANNKYLPESSMDSERVHETPQDMINNVGKSYGVPQGAADDGDGQDAEPDQDE